MAYEPHNTPSDYCVRCDRTECVGNKATGESCDGEALDWRMIALAHMGRLCEKEGCENLKFMSVSWRDRKARVCRAHVGAAIASAVLDGSGDRTTTPYGSSGVADFSAFVGSRIRACFTLRGWRAPDDDRSALPQAPFVGRWDYPPTAIEVEFRAECNRIAAEWVALVDAHHRNQGQP